MSAIGYPRLADLMTGQLEMVPPDCSLEAAVQRMARIGASSVAVVQGTDPLGILTACDLAHLQAGGTPFSAPVVDHMARMFLKAAPDQDFRSAYVQLRHAGVRHLLVVDTAGAPLGLVSESDLCSHLGADLMRRMADLESLVDRDVPGLGPQQTLDQALSRMSGEGNGDFVLVVEDGRPLGILTERDLPGLLGQGADLSAISLASVMRSPLLTVVRGRPIAEALELMERHRVHHLPVLDSDGALFGMLSHRRVMEWLGLELLEDSLEEQRVLRQTSAQIESRLELRPRGRRHGCLGVRPRARPQSLG